MKNKYIFDVCWTLYKSNTTFDFINFFHKSRGGNFYVSILNNKLIKNFLLLIGRSLGIDIYRYLYILSLKGYTKEQLEYIAKNYVKNVLSDKKILFSHEFLNQSLKEREIVKFFSAPLV